MPRGFCLHVAVQHKLIVKFFRVLQARERDVLRYAESVELQVRDCITDCIASILLMPRPVNPTTFEGIKGMS